MAYSFNFDLTKLSQSFFQDLAKFSEKNRVHEKIGNTARILVRKFSIEKITGLPVSDAITLIEDLIDINAKNMTARKEFLGTKKRALLLPHCSRKYMDSRCQAKFDPEKPSYVCQHCSSDCLINQATQLGEKNGYDVYVLPGGSGIKKAVAREHYDGLVGIACTEEIKLGVKLLEGTGIKVQSVPLLKNGCSDTRFNMETLEKTL